MRFSLRLVRRPRQTTFAERTPSPENGMLTRRFPVLSGWTRRPPAVTTAPRLPRLSVFGSRTVTPVTPGPPRAAVTRATSVASLPRRRTDTFARGSQPGVASS